MNFIIESVKKVWNYISIIGVSHELPIELQRNITLTNRFAFTWIFMIIPYVVLFLFVFPIGSMLLTSLILIHVTCILFNRFQLYNVSRIFESTFPSLIIYLLSALFLKKEHTNIFASFYLLNLAFASFPFLFFSLKEYGYIIISLALSVFYFVSFDYANAYFNLGIDSPLQTSKIFEIFNYSVSLALIILGFIYMKRINSSYHDRIMHLLKLTQNYNDRLKEQKNKLSGQKDEITNQHKEVLRQRDLILKQTNEISSSMLYARRIQNAVLPTENEIKEIFADVFIYYVPKEIVSGDFYWVQSVGGFHYIAAADCTGHGVPGGFLSMLGTSFLNEIMSSFNIYIHPNEILNQLRQMIIKSFRQTGKIGETRDGMDIAFCQIDKNNNKLCFSGANNPLYLIRNKELIEYKGDRMPIAFMDDKSDDFTLHEIDIQKDDVFYIFTDGFADQFGGPQGKKFRLQNFKKILLDIHEKSCKDQKLILDNTYREWSQRYDQIDDMLVIGFRV